MMYRYLYETNMVDAIITGIVSSARLNKNGTYSLPPRQNKFKAVNHVWFLPLSRAGYPVFNN